MEEIPSASILAMRTQAAEAESYTNIARRNIDRMTQAYVALQIDNVKLRKDAERYRWLRAEHARIDPICHLLWKRNGDRDGSAWVNTAQLDASIDLAIEASAASLLANVGAKLETTAAPK